MVFVEHIAYINYRASRIYILYICTYQNSWAHRFTSRTKIIVHRTYYRTKKTHIHLARAPDSQAVSLKYFLPHRSPMGYKLILDQSKLFIITSVFYYPRGTRSYFKPLAKKLWMPSVSPTMVWAIVCWFLPVCSDKNGWAKVLVLPSRRQQQSSISSMTKVWVQLAQPHI